MNSSTTNATLSATNDHRTGTRHPESTNQDQPSASATTSEKKSLDLGLGTLDCPSSRRRKATGKIAELPQAQRDLINQLLDDGSTYDKVRREMAQHGVK